jgi:hypothetical protein
MGFAKSLAFTSFLTFATRVRSSGGTKGRPAGARAPAKLFFFNIINNKLLILNYYFISYV